MVRLTADLLTNAPSFVNPVNQRELDLRGHKIPAIENLGITRDSNEAIGKDTQISFPCHQKSPMKLSVNGEKRYRLEVKLTAFQTLQTMIFDIWAIFHDS